MKSHRSLAAAVCMLVMALTAPSSASQSLPAFPGAEGFGAAATGGRGGAVYKVTNLNAGGPGSLQWALDQPDPRIIVFAVSGSIQDDIQIPHGDVTIAGQTAPGAGITILGHLYTNFGSSFGNIVIRHLRVRPPDPDAEWPESQHDAIQFSTNHTIMLDHIDASHGADEIIDLWAGATDVTLQWSAITFPIYDETNGWTHNKGLINHRPCEDRGDCEAGDPPGGRISIHHNLFAHARNRTPALSTGPADVVNNVVYNGREGFVHHNIAGGDFNIVGNVYFAGPSISLAPLWFDPENDTPEIPTRYWVWGNWVDDPGSFVGRVDNPFTTTGFADEYTFYCCGVEANQFNTEGHFDFSGQPGYVAVTSSDGSPAVADAILDRIGAFPRDIVNRWAVEETRDRNGDWGNRRPVDWLDGLTPGTPPADADNDGMADDWESGHGLDPSDGDDHDTIMPSGYTAIEVYINGLAADFFPIVFTDGFESGDASQWSNSHPDIQQVTLGAARTGEYGLEIEPSSACASPNSVVLDNHAVTGVEAFQACHQLTAASGFSVSWSGDAVLTAGSSIALNSRFHVEPGGLLSVAVNPDLKPAAYVEDNSPASETEYHVEFFVNLDGLSLDIGDEIEHFAGYAADGAEQLRIMIRQQAGGPEIVLAVRENTGSFAETPPAILQGGWNNVSAIWKAGAGVSASLSVNGTAPSTLSNLQTGQGRIDYVRWGVVDGIFVKNPGSILMDDFTSSR